jgi:hypothetical protein
MPVMVYAEGDNEFAFIILNDEIANERMGCRNRQRCGGPALKSRRSAVSAFSRSALAELKSVLVIIKGARASLYRRVLLRGDRRAPSPGTLWCSPRL